MTGMVASVIIFGYLGYFCEKYSLKIEHLEISGPGLLFITMPACLSTMFWPALWVVLFFVTMVFIGIDSEFGLVETVCYWVEDYRPRFRGEEIRPEVVKLLCCVGLFVLGLPIATRGGSYYLELVETFGFAIPASLAILGNVVIWGSLCSAVRSTEYRKMFGQLLKATGEAESEFLYFCLEQLGIFISPVMCTVCIYRTVPAAHQFVGAFFEDKFSTAFTLLGCLITLGMLSPPVYYYWAYSGAKEVRDPYVLDLDHEFADPDALAHLNMRLMEQELKFVDKKDVSVSEY